MLFFLNYGGIWILLKIWRVMPRETFWVWRALFLIIQPALFSMGFYLAWQQGQYDDRVLIVYSETTLSLTSEKFTYFNELRHKHKHT